MTCDGDANVHTDWGLESAQNKPNNQRPLVFLDNLQNKTQKSQMLRRFETKEMYELLIKYAKEIITKRGPKSQFENQKWFPN